MKSSEVRSRFLEFFAERDHRVVASSPLVLPNDPTLLFANAGMNQFKDVFTGREQRDYRRAASSQKCLRVSGKHNDLEMVGRTPRHHTFFEMLGNFSFGDYFKREAIAYAWELATKVYGLPAERLWVSVFGGSDSAQADEEAEAIWRDEIGIPTERLLRLGEKENFWRMGDTGPCGPCSEIHFDLGEDLTSVDGVSTPENDERRYLEIWNLVFMQFDQHEDGGLQPLPAPSIDTGMGLERIVSILQGKRTNYDTDLFLPILHAAAERAGKRYGDDEEDDFSMRVISDHARAFCFLVCDGVVPSPDKRGYVLRRLLRRAMRHGRKLGIEEAFLHEITPVVTDCLKGVYPELVASLDGTLEIGRREEQRFGTTLVAGMGRLEDALASTKGALPGATMFELYDTFGFPLDLMRDIADERGVALDNPGFDTEMAKQRERARASYKGKRKEVVSGVYDALAGKHRTQFEGYDRVQLDGVRIAALLRDGEPVDALQEGEEGEIVLEATPFYAESGGQVGDCGSLVGANGEAAVLDAQRPADGLIVHRARVDSGSLATGEATRAAVDEGRRDAIRRNHTATHLVHAALREVIGSHVKQAGSLVAPDRLRFDFSHFASISDETLADIESLVNEKVLADTEVGCELLELEEALRSGAMALFGEKYGDRVRVVTVGEFSKELCGGTHCGRSGEIGVVKLLHERGIASGTRRVEALTGGGALDEFRQAQRVLHALEGQLSVPRERLAEELERRLEQVRTLQREIDALRVEQVAEGLEDAVAGAEDVSGVKLVARRVDGLAAQQLRELADRMVAKLGSGMVVLGRAEGDKASLLVAVTPDLKGRLPAGDVVRSLGKIIGGGGGGRPDRAEAGGKNPEKLDEALAQVPAEVRQRLEDSPSASGD
ncbi:MAG: alanine--tRNA ligase [bacterium]|nr:alanine--tRNA ligase [bacterium]